MTFVSNWAAQTWNLLVEASPWLLVGFVLAGAVYVLVPMSRVTQHLGRPGLSAVLKASLLGIPLPLCSCSVIPVAASIRKQGASRGAFASFLISTPETGVDSVAISYALLGPLLTIVRPVAAFVTAAVAGLLVDGTAAAESNTTETHSDDSSCDDGGAPSCCCAEPATKPSAFRKIVTAVRYGLVEMITDLSPWLVLGFLLAGLAATLIPEGFLHDYIGTGLPAMLLMLVVGLPMYVCSTSSTPIAAALIARGLSPGAALVFLMAGPATNVATMVVVSRDLGRRGLLIYLSCIAGVAILFGLAIDAILPSLPVSLAHVPSCTNGHTSSIGWPAAVAFIFLTFNGLRLRLKLGSRA